MAGPSGQQPFVEDDSSSTVSFENVRLEKKSQRMTAARLGGDHDAPHSAENAVPDVLYVVQYRDYQGRVVETRKSDKPLDVALDAPQDAGGESAGGIQQRPVLEIITKVSTIRNAAGRHGQPFYRPRPRHGRAVYSSDDDEYRAYDARAGPASPVTRIETSEMIVHSHHLRNALNAVVTYYPELDLMGPTLRVEAPYRVLVLHMKELERYKLNQPQAHDEDYAQTTARHIDVLLAFLKSSLGDDIEREQRRWASSTPTATYDYFWLLLKPGEVVYHKVDGHWSPVVVSRVSRGYVDDDGRQRSGSYVVDCWYVEFVDGLMQRFMDSFVVPPFSGEQALRTLPVLPARFFPGGAEETRAKQVRLGRLYWELAKRPAYKEYDGPMIGKDSCPTGHLAGRVVVDCDGYDRFKDVRPSSSRLHRPLPTSSPRKNRTGPRTAIPPKDQLPDFAPRCPCAACQPTQRLPSKGGHLAGGEQQKTGPLAGFEDLDPNEDGPPDNELYFEVTVDYVPAFVLSQRRWAMLQVADLQDVRADREAFRHLVLDDEIKLTVKALIGKTRARAASSCSTAPPAWARPARPSAWPS
ncbi:hypothetical protein VTK73DRAFT_8586 [Phialemonium thermophilum]|uniref:DUF7025 domain-containing protein n=1 Tax=Phialemonium thermophilum TaxID=223376 RepID=A0ABR3W7K6_9PEZI